MAALSELANDSSPTRSGPIVQAALVVESKGRDESLDNIEADVARLERDLARTIPVLEAGPGD